MKTLRRNSILATAVLLFITAGSFLVWNTGIIKFKSTGLDVSIKGTSSLHDWEMKSSKGNCDVAFTLDAADRITAITEFQFSVPAESIKSGHSGMDKNAYKALNTNKFKTFNFVLIAATITTVAPNSYQVKATGNMTIAGVTKKTELVGTAKYNASDKSFVLFGSKKIKMTDFGIKPPTAMLGAIKTGDDLTIAFATRVVRK